MAPPSIFRNPDAKHYSVRHRSQRDPLINDPDNGERILLETRRKNQPKAQTKEDGQPSSYNIFYDDPDYDYLQHLRPIGTSTDAIFIGKPNRKANHQQPISLCDDVVPETLQATPDHHTLSYKDHLEFALPSNSAIPDDSLLPVSDDPALREVLDALEDEAYVEEETDDNFFESIIKDGEIDPNQPLEEHHPPQSGWESEIARFKSTKTAQFDDTSSVASDTFGTQKPATVGRKANRSATSARGSFAGSAFSMSSSAMFRNEGLTDLDDRFDQIEKEYQSDDDDDDSNCSEVTTTPKVREDFEAIMDEFLDRFEVLGGKMKPALAGKTPMEKLDTLRAELLGPSSLDPATDAGDVSERKLVKEKILAHLRAHQQRLESLQNCPKTRPDDNLVFNRFDVDDNRYENKWDCQTILSTYSNLENHPRLIRIREAIGGEGGKKSKTEKSPSSEPTTSNGGGKIGIDRATGFPVVDGKVITPSSKTLPTPDSDPASSDDESTCSVKGIIKRDRNEDKESKKLRKAQVKAERAVRRQVKKSIKQTFTNEKNKQEAINSKLLVKKSVDIAGIGGKHVISLV